MTKLGPLADELNIHAMDWNLQGRFVVELTREGNWAIIFHGWPVLGIAWLNYDYPVLVYGTPDRGMDLIYEQAASRGAVGGRRHSTPDSELAKLLTSGQKVRNIARNAYVDSVLGDSHSSYAMAARGAVAGFIAVPLELPEEEP